MVYCLNTPYARGFYSMKTPSTLIVEIHVIPGSSRVGFFFDSAHRLKCRLKSPPEKGLANQELVRLVAQLMGVSQSCVSIISGQSARKKRLQLIGVTDYAQFLNKIGLVQPDTQLSLLK